ncbi:MAG: SHOCT domain-containing protein [Bacteroidales bacterium]|nr:SHOCT domain-containing protein [Candidatus Scybalousia scybalohippi]
MFDKTEPVNCLIKVSDITYATIGSQIENTSYTIGSNTTNTESMLGRAAVGGLLLGGVGATVGALTASSSSRSTTFYEKKYPTLTIWTKDPNHERIFLSPSYGAKDLLSFANAVLEDIFNQRKKDEEPSEKKINSAADELKKFAELKEQGIITEEEFIQQKKKLLS